MKMAKIIALLRLSIELCAGEDAAAYASATAAEVSVPPCVDNDALCFMWSQVGECESSNRNYMRLRCARSCGICDASQPPPAGTPKVVVLDGPASSQEVIPFPLSRSDPVVEMAAGELHLVLRLASGAVLTFGDDSMGQLGQPKLGRALPQTRRAPEKVEWPPPNTGKAAVAIGAGRMYSAALLADGTLMLWGENTHGQCGVPTEYTAMDAAPAELLSLSMVTSVPMQLALKSPVKAFSLGEMHSLVLTTDGAVHSFGDGTFGATCNRTEEEMLEEAEAEQASAEGKPIVTSELTARLNGFKCNLPLEPGENVTALTAGGFHSLITTSAGRVLGWGDNTHGQLGSDRKYGFIYSLLQDAQAPGGESITDDELDRELDAAFLIAEVPLHLLAGETVLKLMTRSFHTAALTSLGRLLVTLRCGLAEPTHTGREGRT